MKRSPLAAAVLAGALLYGPAAAAVRIRVLPPLTTDSAGIGFSRPEGVGYGAGRLAVTDTGAGRIVTFAVTATGVATGPDFTVPEVPYPIRVAVTSRKEMFVLDGRLHRIARLGAGGEFKGYLDFDGIPRAIAVDRADRLTVLDVTAPRLVTFDGEGKREGARDLPAGAGFFSDIAVDGKGDTYLLDSVGRQLYVYRSGATEAVPLGASLGEDLAFPTSLAVTGSGLVAVLDQYGGGIVFVGPDGSTRGRQLAMGWREGFLRYPSGIASDGGDALFVADRENNRVQVLTLAP